MDKKGRRAQEEVELAEAELKVLKQELVVQHLIDTGEPTDEAWSCWSGCAPLQRRSRRKGRLRTSRMAKRGRPNTQLWTSRYASRLLITMKLFLHRAFLRRYCPWLVTPRG